jgi:hypothetical protein
LIWGAGTARRAVHAAGAPVHRAGAFGAGVHPRCRPRLACLCWCVMFVGRLAAPLTCSRLLPCLTPANCCVSVGVRACVHLYVCVCLCVCVCARVRACTYMRAQTRLCVMADPAGLVVDPSTKQPVELCPGGSTRRLQPTLASLRAWVESLVALWLRDGCVCARANTGCRQAGR